MNGTRNRVRDWDAAFLVCCRCSLVTNYVAFYLKETKE